jgi:mono/diheme cytochrome c family protein
MNRHSALLLGAVALATSMARAADQSAYPDGASTFKANCVVCHGAAGAGVPSLAPPLLANPAHYAASAEGRRQLAMTVLFGLIGDISVDGKHYNFQMPDFARFDDEQLAAVLNFVVFDLDQAKAVIKPITASEIAAERAAPKDANAVHEHRQSVAPP